MLNPPYGNNDYTLKWIFGISWMTMDRITEFVNAMIESPSAKMMIMWRQIIQKTVQDVQESPDLLEHVSAMHATMGLPVSNGLMYDKNQSTLNDEKKALLMKAWNDSDDSA